MKRDCDPPQAAQPDTPSILEQAMSNSIPILQEMPEPLSQLDKCSKFGIPCRNLRIQLTVNIWHLPPREGCCDAA